MADGSSIETFPGSASSLNGAHPSDDATQALKSVPVRTALVFAGLALVSAAVAFTIVRGITRRRPSDPTTERIQQLIDEANRLLKALDEKQPGR